MSPLLAPSPEVADALAAGRPVVALETTIVSHGMPWPENRDTALAVEAVVRAAGAVPAAIAVIGGRIKVGLSQAELEALAQARDVLKLSSADLAYGLASGRTGATTVAATMIAAHRAGIGVFGRWREQGAHGGAFLAGPAAIRAVSAPAGRALPPRRRARWSAPRRRGRKR